jgi:hypothetical protein
MEKMKITIKRYAENEGISVQSVYAKIKRGNLKSIEENGVKYVLLEDETIKPKVENTLNETFKIIKRLQKENKLKDKEIKRLTKQLAKCNKKSEKVYLSYIAELKHLQLKAPVNIDEDIIEVKSKKKKSKKKRKKNG